MPASTGPERMSVVEFLARPEPETGHYELIDGELVVSWPTYAHERAALNLAAELRSWRRAEPGRGRISLAIDSRAGEASIVGPDLQWWAAGRVLPSETTRPWPLGDLVVEVRSPSTWAVDVGRKRTIYEEQGVQELWLVDPLSETILIFARSAPEAAGFDRARDLGPEDVLDSPLMPGFSVGVAGLFRE